jgi:hypothetical protein
VDASGRRDRAAATATETPWAGSEEPQVEIMTAWEREILVVLANHLRVVSIAQMARIWWAGLRTGTQRARASMKSLDRNGWVKFCQVLSRPVEPLKTPIVSWGQGAKTPDFGEVSRFLRRRSHRPAYATPVVTAARKTRALFGKGDTRSLKLTQVTHDLHVAEIYFRYWETGYAVSRYWVSEDYLPKPWGVRERPDAILQDGEGNILRALDYGGNYTPGRLAKLHDGLAYLAIPYEIW